MTAVLLFEICFFCPAESVRREVVVQLGLRRGQVHCLGPLGVHHIGLHRQPVLLTGLLGALRLVREGFCLVLQLSSGHVLAAFCAPRPKCQE